MTDEILHDISEKLSVLIKLIATSLARDLSQTEQILLLGKADLSPKLIARIISTTSGTVSVKLSNLRKKGLLPKASIKQ